MAAHCLAEGTGRKRNLEVATAGTDGERRLRWQHGGKFEDRRQIAQLRRSYALPNVGVPSRPALMLPSGAHLHEDDGHRRRAGAASAAADVHVADQASRTSRSELGIRHYREDGVVPAQHAQPYATLELEGAASGALDGSNVHRDDIVLL